MATGTVKWFKVEFGFGFVTPDEGDKDIYVSMAAIENIAQKSEVEGRKVEYEVENVNGRPQISKIQFLT